MTDKTFWTIIDASSADTQDEQSAKLKAELSKLSKEELIAFESSYRAKLAETYHWDLWAGAYIINGGCSDDGFDYFCDWLISRGQTVYESALENPETLVGIATPWDTEYEDFRYIMMDVMSEDHKSDFPMPQDARPASPAGEDWDEETVGEKYPKLNAWVESEIVSSPPPVHAAEPKPGFWQRLFGKS